MNSPEEVPRRQRRFYRQEQSENEKQQAKPERQVERRPLSFRGEEQQKPVQGQKNAKEKTAKAREQGMPEAIFDELQEQKKKDAKKESMKLAVNEIRRFKEEYNRLPKGNEYDEIAENIYQQIKRQEDREKEEQRHGSERQQQPGLATAIQQQAQPAAGKTVPEMQKMPKLDMKNLDVKDLFGESGSEEKELKLEDISTGLEDELKLEGLDEGIDAFPKELETDKNNCPNCKAKTEEIVFCPDCGTAFCAHCAKSASTEAGITKYVCPKCSKEVKAQK